MASVPTSVDQAKQAAEDAVEKVSPAVEGLARLGFAAKGAVYLIIGTLATKAAVGTGGRTTDPEGALRTIHQQPFGQILLTLAGLGLAGYALWRLTEAALNPSHGRGKKDSVFKRLGYFVSGVVHAGLAFTALQMVFAGERAASGDSSNRDWTASLLSQPAGAWLVIILGASVMGVGAWQLWRAWKVKLGEQLSLGELGPGARRWVLILGRLGYAARGIVFGLIGLFFILAARRHDAGASKGIGGALESIASLDYGPWLLGAVGLGLGAYGLFELIESRYRRIDVG